MNPRLLAIARRAAFELVFAAVTLQCARPAFSTVHLPLQDLPQHMAAISVLRRYVTDPGIREYVELTLSRTQYLLVYALGVPLSVPFGVEYATRLLVALTVVATPYALRYAMRRTGGDERLACLAWPFAWNPQMMLGFLNFLLGVPVALWAIGLFADPATRRTRRRQVGLALLALAAFYSHLIPYGILGLGVLAQLDTAGAFANVRARFAPEGEGAEPLWPRVRRAGAEVARGASACVQAWTAELFFLVPSLLAAAVWVFRSPARDPAVRAGGVGREIVLIWPDRAQLPSRFRDEILNLGGDADEYALIAWGLGLLAALAFSRAFDAPAVEAPSRDGRARVAWLPLACAVLYVRTPESYGWIWPIHTRFAVAAVLVLPLAFQRTRQWWFAWALIALMATTTWRVNAELAAAFQRYDAEEVGDLDAALARAEPRRRLVALVPAMRSAHVPSNVPLLHAAAYYQIRGGYVATFSFADFPQSPFRYREGRARPPRLRPRWEWETSLREADPGYDYYDYVLARAGYDHEPAQLPDRYERVYSGTDWVLYRRRR